MSAVPPPPAVPQPQTHLLDASPYDALLLVSFGGPEKPEDVVPFLENVTRGRGIPKERLEEVGEHYFRFGGRSPLNDLNREFIAAVEEDFKGAGLDLPVYWGNRNWDPYLHDAVERMRTDGVRRALCLLTSAYSSYSGCRQYRENLAGAVATVEEARTGGPETPRLDRLRHYFNHPGFVETMVDATSQALSELPDAVRGEAHLLFVTHSIPTAMNEASGLSTHVGRGSGGNAYVRQHESVVDLVVERLRGHTGHRFPAELTFCSRSGPPSVPWLEPDVGDRIQELAAQDVRAVVVVPIGFVADHMEVIYDLDVEAAEAAEESGVAFARAATAGVDPRFVTMVRELVLERAAVERAAASGAEETERAEGPARPALGDLGPSWDVCPPGCCRNPRGDRPALCGSD
jgi:protoporphyrin/coproporphyrin ferrochelatase